MQEDGLEEFWWDEFVALTVGRKEGRKMVYSVQATIYYVLEILMAGCYFKHDMVVNGSMFTESL